MRISIAQMVISVMLLILLLILEANLLVLLHWTSLGILRYLTS
jgi:hypothetical protein